MEFQEALGKYFRVRGNIADGLGEQPRPRGRWALAKAMADMGFRSGVEIGTLYGDSAEIWCSTNPQMHLTCIDPYGPYRKRGRLTEQQDAAFEAASKRLSVFNVTMVRKKSLEVVDQFANDSLDFVNIDGDHSFDAAIMDIVSWVPKVRKGGLILVHDYCTLNWQGVSQAVNAYVNAHRIDPWYICPDVSPTAFWQKGAEKWVR